MHKHVLYINDNEITRIESRYVHCIYTYSVQHESTTMYVHKTCKLMFKTFVKTFRNTIKQKKMLRCNFLTTTQHLM